MDTQFKVLSSECSDQGSQQVYIKLFSYISDTDFHWAASQGFISAEKQIKTTKTLQETKQTIFSEAHN